MRAIFVSYRREDSEGQAGRLFKDLAGHFGEDCVFMDVAGIEPGRDFRRVIDDHVASCGVLLAMIGKSWVDARDEAGRRRLDDAGDFVRLETAAALKRDIPVIPVLVHGAQMPRVDQLPEDLAELAYRNGVELTHARWDSDVQVLIKALDPYVESSHRAQAHVSATPVPAPRNLRSSSAAPAVADVVAGQAVSNTTSGRRRSIMATVGVAAVLVLALSGYLLTQGAPAQEPSPGVPPQGAAQQPPVVDTDVKPPQKEARAKPAGGNSAEEKHDTRAADDRRRRDAEQRARWRTYEFPPPNGGFLVYTITPDGNPACASYDGNGCLWGQTYDDIDFSKLKPLECGDMHKALWGVTGYDDPKHWCSVAKVVKGNPS